MAYFGWDRHMTADFMEKFKFMSAPPGVNLNLRMCRRKFSCTQSALNFFQQLFFLLQNVTRTHSICLQHLCIFLYCWLENSRRSYLHNLASLHWFGWLVVLGLTVLLDNISVYIGPSPREREKEKRSDRLEKKCPNNPHPHLLQAQ